MQRIKIYENDNTFNSVAGTNYPSAVLIPGFAVSDSENDDTLAPMGELVECVTPAEFVKYFGKTAPKFKDGSNIYPYLGDVDPGDPVDTSTFEVLKTSSEYSPEQGYQLSTFVLVQGLEPDIPDGIYQANQNIEEPAGDFDKAKWEVFRSVGDILGVKQPDSKKKNNEVIKLYRVALSRTQDEKLYFDPIEYIPSTKGFPKTAIPIETSSDTENQSYANIKMFEDDYDPSWRMAFHLVRLGFPVIYVRMNKCALPEESGYDVTPARAYEFMEVLFNKNMDPRLAPDDIRQGSITSPLLDKNMDIRFITSGGYPTFEYNKEGTENFIVDEMLQIAEFKQDPLDPEAITGRGDCCILVDHTDNYYRALTGATSVFESNKLGGGLTGSYGTMFTPWCNINLSGLSYAPASFVYLYNLAVNGMLNTPWGAVAGVARGKSPIVTSLRTRETLTNRIAEYYQNNFDNQTKAHPSINPLTYIRNYGFCIWGDRTLEKYVTNAKGFATAFLHVRNLVSDVKKLAYNVSQELMFEVNDFALWTKFKLRMSVLLDQMVSANALTRYTFTKNVNPDKTLLAASITLYPTYGLEKVEISINLENDTEPVLFETEE